MKQFLARKDVWFGVVGTTATAMLIYADRLPVWALLAIVLVREVFGAIGMKKGQE